jgi:hypothetical protein
VHIHARGFDPLSLPGAEFLLEKLVQGFLLPLPTEPGCAPAMDPDERLIWLRRSLGPS